MLRSQPATRRSQTVAYVLFALSGAAAEIWPAPSVEKTSDGGWIFLVWVAFLVVGGAASAAGRVSGRWLGEFLGLPLLATVFVIYGGSAIYLGAVEHRPAAFAGGACLAAITALLGSRWFEVNQIRIEAVARARRRAATQAAAAGRLEEGIGPDGGA